MKKLLAKKSDKKTEFMLEIPKICQCGFKNFYVWGTRTNGETHIEVHCMNCGRKNWIVSL